jgi:hypothetical protein
LQPRRGAILVISLGSSTSLPALSVNFLVSALLLFMPFEPQAVRLIVSIRAKSNARIRVPFFINKPILSDVQKNNRLSEETVRIIHQCFYACIKT